MSTLCIGGVCIPYAGLVPLLLLALKWVAEQLAKVGLLPDFIIKSLGLHSSSSATCCASTKTTEKTQRRRRTARESSTATTSDETTDEKDDDEYNNCSNITGGEVEHIDTLTRWTEVFTQSKKQSSSLLFVKFTAEWCKPCRVIQPTYIELASKNTNCKFVTLDVDGDGCDILSGKLRVGMMPTFICFRDGGEIGRMSGGKNKENLMTWVEKMSS